MFRYVIVLALGWGVSGAARAETINCTNITSLPAVITSQGVYCLKQNLATSISGGYAIDIQANNVTLDCNGFKIGGLAAGAGTRAWGIHSMSDGGNVTVRNCNVRGFATGIGLYGGLSGRSGDVVSGNRIDGNTLRGLDIQSDGAQVIDNMIVATGGSTYYAEPGYSATAIQTIYDVDVIGNTVWGVVPLAGGVRTVGIHVFGNGGGSVEDNRVRGLSGTTVEGIYVDANNSRVRIIANSVAGPGVPGATGIHCAVNTGGVAIDNRLSGFSTLLSNCYNGGGNVYIP